MFNDITEPKTLIVSNSPEIENAIKNLLSMIFKITISVIVRSNQHKGLIVIDEFATFTIPNIDKFLAVSREYKLGCLLAFPDIDQLDHNYSKEVSNVIMANCNYQYYGKANSPKTIEIIKNMFEFDYEN